MVFFKAHLIVLALLRGLQQSIRFADVNRMSAQDSGEISQRWADLTAAFCNFKFADRVFVVSVTFFKHGNAAADGSQRFKVPESITVSAM
jgi:hypothetical protein